MSKKTNNEAVNNEAVNNEAVNNEAVNNEAVNEEAIIAEAEETGSALEALNPAHIQTVFHFKNESLNRFSEQIAKIAIDSVSRNIQLARILGRVLESECYSPEFKSVKEYAFTTFQIPEARAYALARAGMYFYNSKDETAQRVVKLYGASPFKLAELTTVPADKLKEALDGGNLKPDATEKDLREYVKAAKPSKPKVIKMYNLEIAIASMHDGHIVRMDSKNNIDADNILAAAGFDADKDKLIKLGDIMNGDKVKEGILYAAIKWDGTKTATITAREVKPEAKPKEVSPENQNAALVARIAEVDPEKARQIAAILGVDLP